MSETGTVKFVEFHQPPLDSGEYKIEVEQTIKASDKISPKSFRRELTFAVTGERFGPLSPEGIFAVFPPRDSLGEHSNVVPHITLKRSTLPWERTADPSDHDLPWLVLLLFRDSDFEQEADKPKPKNITLGRLKEDGVKFPNIDLEVGQSESEQVTVIDVKKKYLLDILPAYEDLPYLSHVRWAEDAVGDVIARTEEEDDDHEFATIISNRLPEHNGSSTAYLVSVEERYTTAGFDYRGAGDEDLVRLVSLHSWSFDCVELQHSFTELLKNLNRAPSSLRLPTHDDPDVEEWLTKGYLPLPHAMREGSQTISWYRSPFIPGYNPDRYEFPVKASDELLRYDADLGLFDTSYAAAWELGRMLMLQNQGLAMEFFNWKRQHAQELNTIEQKVLNLPLVSEPNGNNDIPPAIDQWFSDLEQLKGVPFNYLVPDERLLPPESIRFFWVDSLWVDCLQDGAFSIGRVTKADVVHDCKLRANRALNGSNRGIEQEITGILMRSQVVSGWPHLLIDGYDKAVNDGDSIEPQEANLLPLLRMEKLAENVLICLFEGEVKTLDVHLQPEGMHFGLDTPPGSPWTKNLRDTDGEPLNPEVKIPVPWQNEEKEVIHLADFANNMNEYLNLDRFSSGQFALQMIEGVQKVRFTMQG